MTTRTKAALALVVLLAAAAFLAVRVSAGGGRHPRLRARLDLVERHFADLTTSSDTVEVRLQALAVRVADLEARLAECHCAPPPACTPCTCAAAGAACGQDADGDGVDDCLDRCPCEPGPSDQAGCPRPPPPPPCSPCPCVVGGGPCGHDADHDGIDDCTDACPCDPGPAENKGCPRPICEPCTSCATVPCGHDADGDGVDDCADACPCRPGPDTNRGCPMGRACQTDADCDDGNGCSLDVCLGGVCEHKCLCLGPAGFDCGPGPAR
ncbi:MAG: hypothetical protein E6J68_03610 [Deltaproteobacteria bacterium]|nr:MAG: hypothetical protein E6J68_03610 [Deltaproteobacteria bacterium]